MLVSLKENAAFRRLYHRGKTTGSRYLVIYCSKNRLGVNRFGMTVSTKLGHAVVRNRMRRRLREIYRDMCQLLDTIRPDAVAVEELFFNTNQTTGIRVAEARGVILMCAHGLGVKVFEYTPLQVKQSVVGYGRAEKKQVQEMTRVILKLEKIPKPDDTADALAMAICHAHASGSLMGRLRNIK